MRCRGPYRTSCWRKRHTSHSAAQAQWREDDRVRSRTTTLGERRSMAEYTIVSVADVPDQAAEVGMDPEHFELRFLGESLGLRNFSLTFERFGAGWQPPQGHAHRRGPRPTTQREVYRLLSGGAR